MDAPEFIGNYTIGACLHQGTGADTYLARDLGESREVVIKLAKGASRSLERRHAAFLVEARVAQSVQHPNILAVLDAGMSGKQGETGSRPYLIMERVADGHTLAEHCNPENLLPVSTAIDYVIQCASALDKAHKLGIIHRGVKPRSIFLDSSGVAKLTGFGNALVEGADHNATLDSRSLASPLYLSPEQVMGWDVGLQSDIFALGVLLYELLTGRHPFTADLIPAISENITRKAHAPVRSYRPQLPHALEIIVERALKKHPAGRYRAAMDLVGDLSLVLDTLDVAIDGPGADVKSELIGLAAKLEFFAAFSVAQLEEIEGVSVLESFPPGATIVSEGDDGDSLFVLLLGAVEVRRAARVLATLEPGTAFGEIGFAKHRPRNASIIAIDETVAMEVRRAHLKRLSTQSQLLFHEALNDVLVERIARLTEVLSLKQ